MHTEALRSAIQDSTDKLQVADLQRDAAQQDAWNETLQTEFELNETKRLALRLARINQGQLRPEEVTQAGLVRARASREHKFDLRRKRRQAIVLELDIRRAWADPPGRVGQ